MHQQHESTSQPANRSIQENTGSRGIQLPSVKVLQQPNTAPASVLQGVFTDADKVTLDMVAKYIGEKNKHMLGAFEAAAIGSTSAGSIDTWLQTNLGVTLSEVRSWHGERKEETSMDLEPVSVSKDSEKESEKKKITVTAPNSLRVRVGPKGFGVFNLFSYAGQKWLATAFHIVNDIDGQYGKGPDSAPAFFAGNNWASAAKEVMKDAENDYILYLIDGVIVKCPEIELGTINRSASETLTVNTPARDKGFSTSTINVWERKPTKTPEYIYDTSGIIKYKGGQGGDSGAAITNAGGQFVGLHQSDFGGIGFKEGSGIFRYLMQQKQK